ncbi:MAG: CCA tRNA nucleotidyltransferase [Terracidiphilus sp.]|jgi:tRNA nucleotidyltransferase/poly(A) polymerase
MPDYIYLLENRLSPDQQHALRQVREAAREAGTILFLTGDAVRDLTNGQSVRDLEVAIHGNPLKLKKIIEKLGGSVWGEDEAAHSLYLCFPGTVRLDLISTHRVEYPRPGRAVFHPASIQEDLRRRDFTANAMAISLNEGSFGLLMDPLNGVADIEGKTLRLVSNYGFLEEPSLLIRATRYKARLGWELDTKTQTRYENAKGENVIEHLSAEARSQELEQIGHEEDGLKVLSALEAEGWMQVLFPAWGAAKADEEKLKALHQLAAELLAQGVHADMSAAQMQLLTAKLNPREIASLKKLTLRPGFVEEWSSLDALAARFAKVLLFKENATPSATFKLFASYDPEAVLWLGFTSKDVAVQERYNLFLKVWPEVRQRIPHALMQEMRITPELAAYREIVQAVFLELIDGKLTTPEEARAYLEPHSPPAPPPQVSIKRPRAKRGAEPKVKERSYDDEDEPEDELDEDVDDLGGDEEEIDLGLSLPKGGLATESAEDAETLEDDVDGDESEADVAPPAPGKRGSKGKSELKSAKESPLPSVTPTSVPAKSGKPAVADAAVKSPAGEAAKVEKDQAVSKAKAEPKPQPKTGPAAAPAKAALKPASPVAKGKAAPAKPVVPAVKKAPPAPVAGKGNKAAKPVATKVAIKSQVKGPVQAKGKVPAKSPVKRPVKPKGKTAATKPAPAKGKPAAKASSKAPKGAGKAKAPKSSGKKIPSRAGKKR